MSTKEILFIITSDYEHYTTVSKISRTFKWREKR